MGWSFLGTLQIQEQGELGIASPRPESKIDLYIWPMGAGVQGSSLVSSSVQPASLVASEASKTQAACGKQLARCSVQSYGCGL